MTLYEITGEMMQLLLMSEDPDSEDINPEIYADTFEGLEGEFEEKCDAWVKVIRQLQADSASLKAENDRITARRRSIDNSVDRMINTLKTAMIAVNKPKFKTTLFSYGIQKNPPKVVIDDPSRIYQDYLIEQEPKIDTAAIKDALKNADEAPLWEGIAHLEQGESLRIR